MGANSKKSCFFAKICCKFLAFLIFFAEKMLKMTISTSIWGAQHPNSGRNIQQATGGQSCFLRQLINWATFLSKKRHVLCLRFGNHLIFNFSLIRRKNAYLIFSSTVELGEWVGGGGREERSKRGVENGSTVKQIHGKTF